MSRSPTELPNGWAASVELTETDRHRLLTSKRRRTVLDVLADLAAPIELEELVEAIAAREDDAPIPDRELEHRIAISLHHEHLPMMADVGAIDYDPASTRVESVRVTADVRPP